MRFISCCLLAVAALHAGAATTTSTISFQTASVAVAENAGSVSVTVQRTGDLTQPASVQFTTVDASAVAGEDFVIASGTLSFSIDQSTIVVPITLINDTVAESTEQFQVNLSGAGGNGVLGAPATATVTISDDDGGVSTGAGTVTSGSTTGSTSSSSSKGCGRGGLAPAAAGVAALIALRLTGRRRR